MLAKKLTEGRQFLARRSAVNILIGGLVALDAYGPSAADSCSPNHKGGKRASTPYKHRGEGRCVLGTSKDVMPAIAGYTSTSCDHVNHQEKGGV